MVYLLFCVVFLGIGLVKGDTEDDGYSGNVKVFFENLTEYAYHVTTAREKMNEFKSESWDRKYAIAIINLYTQPGMFYLTLNSEMKNKYPANTDLWKRAGDLINRAVDILGAKLFDHVYRGCQVLDDIPKRGEPYNFDHIVTASLYKHTSVSFIECANNFIFQIDKVYGVPIERYTHYSQDKEVIIKSNNTFNVVDGPQKDGKNIVYILSGQADESVISVNSGKQNSGIHVLVIVIPVIVGVVIIIVAILVLRYKCCQQEHKNNMPNKEPNQSNPPGNIDQSSEPNQSDASKKSEQLQEPNQSDASKKAEQLQEPNQSDASKKSEQLREPNQSDASKKAEQL